MNELVGIFFWVNDEFLFHGCKVEAAEEYGDFRVYDKSHFEIWDEFYFQKYHKDYDYFPRGRVVYDMTTESFVIYKDNCIGGDEMKVFLENYEKVRCRVERDEHYQYHMCNSNYVDLVGILGGFLEVAR